MVFEMFAIVYFSQILLNFITDSSTLGEIFNPARDCPDIVEQIPEAEDGFYWIVLPNGKKHKVRFEITGTTGM